MEIKSELAKIVGKKYVSDSVEDLAKYARDYSLLPPGSADVVACRKPERGNLRVTSDILSCVVMHSTSQLPKRRVLSTQRITRF